MDRLEITMEKSHHFLGEMTRQLNHSGVLALKSIWGGDYDVGVTCPGVMLSEKRVYWRDPMEIWRCGLLVSRCPNLQL